jgi:hypothetical protein
MKATSAFGLAAAATAAAVLLGTTPALAATTGTQDVTGTVPTSMSVSVGQPTVAFPSLTPGTAALTADGGTVTVQSNASYVVTLTDNGGLSSDDGTTFLGSSLEASSTTTSTTGGTGLTASAIDTTVGTAGDGIAIGGSDQATAGDDYAVTLTQPVAWTDAPAAYSDTLTYTVSAPVAP